MISDPEPVPAAPADDDDPPSLGLKLLRRSRLAKRVVAVELGAAGGSALPAVTPGSILTVKAGAVERDYMIANLPEETGSYELALLLDAGSGAGARWLAEQAEIGATIWARLPKPGFRIDERADRHLLVAGGIGIAGLRALACRLADEGRDLALYYCTRDAAEAPWLDTLRARLGRRLEIFHDGGTPTRGLHLDWLLKDRRDGTALYVCGPPSLLRAAAAATGAWPAGSVRSLRFRAEDDGATAEAGFTIRLVRAGLTLDVPADRSIVAVLEAAGIAVPTVCREGWCGTCRVGLIGGEAIHRDDCLEPDERRAAIQVCVSRGRPGGRLDLDL